eukprot:5542824-Pleurochrysis_carterae.AAC.3
MAAVHDCAPASRGSCRAGGTGPPAAFEFVPGYSFEALDAEELRIEKEAEQEERRVAREEQWATETLNSQVQTDTKRKFQNRVPQMLYILFAPVPAG